MRRILIGVALPFVVDEKAKEPEQPADTEEEQSAAGIDVNAPANHQEEQTDDGKCDQTAASAFEKCSGFLAHARFP